jgi:hypothetical protein
VLVILIVLVRLESALLRLLKRWFHARKEIESD